jgi:hypothetical protein
MHHQDQQVLVRSQNEQPGAQRRLRGQVERVRRRPGERTGQIRGVDRPSRELRRHLDVRQVGRGELTGLTRTARVDDLDHRQFPWQGVELHDALARLAVDPGERRTQHLMASDNVPKRLAQRPVVQLAGQAQDHAVVVGRVRALELRQEPQPALRERQRYQRDSSCSCLGRSAGLAFFGAAV